MATLNVGAGQTYATVSAAVNASRDGDVIAVRAGTYVNDFATITKDITIMGVGGMANFVATVAPPNGKGIFVVNGDVTIENLSFSGAAVSDMNGAGIRYEGGNLVISDSYFHHNQDGLLAAADPNGTIRIVNSEFAYNGAGDGQSHNIYVNNIASLVIDNSYFHDASIGHQIKSRAQSTTVTNSRIYDGTGTGSYSIDLPNGGKGIIRGNVIQQGPNTDNPSIIHYGGESAAYEGSSLIIADNVFVNQKSGTALLLNNATTVTGTLSGNSVYGLSASQITNAGETSSGTTYLSSSPPLDTSAPWLDDGGSGPSPTLGTTGADKLVGTAGADTMTGLAGNDQYVVNHAGDVVVEANGQGTDTVLSSVSYTLPANVENLTLTGSGNINATGNALANVLTGNAGNNTLDGGAGADKMIGGLGNDTYRVDHAGDVIVEASGQGTDTVSSSVSYALAANVEKLTLTGSGNINGTGNDLTNVVTGNAGNNVLNGGAGADTMTGGAGNDTYRVDSAGDVVVEANGQGTDGVLSTVSYSLGSNVENLTLAGSGNINATGNSQANKVLGNDGNNILDGRGGADTLTGNGGADSFVFRDKLGPSNIDTIADFNVAQDTIRLENSVFTAITGTGTLTAAQFVANASGVATSASQHIVYETDTGKLFYDSNGSAAGGTTQVAQLSPHLDLTHTDFFII